MAEDEPSVFPMIESMSSRSARIQPRSPPPWRRWGLEVAMLGVVWLVLSGHYDAFHLGLGAVSLGLVFWINRRFSGSRTEGPPAADVEPPLRLIRAAAYVPWLVWQMCVAGLQVARVVIRPRLQVSPQVVRFRSRQPGDLARVILGNSITLTPGTLTLEVEGDEFVVHALTEETARGLLDGSMQTKVARLFVDSPADMVTEVRVTPVE